MNPVTMARTQEGHHPQRLVGRVSCEWENCQSKPTQQHEVTNRKYCTSHARCFSAWAFLVPITPNDPSSPMNAPQETLELHEPLAGQSLGAAPCSATVEKPHKVHVWVCGHYCGPYEFATAEEADADYEYRKGFRVLGCYYRRESPNEKLTDSRP